MKFLFDVAAHIVADLIVIAIVACLGLLTFRRLRLYVKAFGFARRMLRNGVVNFYCDRSEYRTARSEHTLADYMLRAMRTFTYVGFYLSSATDAARNDNALRELLARGCQVELVLLDERIDDEFLSMTERQLGIAAGTLRGRLEGAHRHFAEFAGCLSAEQRARFSVRRHSVQLASSAMFLDYGERDGRLLIDTKIHGAGREASYGIEFRTVARVSSLADAYAASFRRIAATAR
jgi:hypothetical protein